MPSSGNARRGRDKRRALKDVLIVDDEESLAFFLQQGLLEIDDDWVVDTANTGEEAVIKINRSIYRLIIADLRMPGLNGLELLQMVRALEPTTKVILMTAYGSDEIEAEAKRLRVFRYVTKPFRIEDMKSWARASLGYDVPDAESAEAEALPAESESVDDITADAEPAQTLERASEPVAEPALDDEPLPTGPMLDEEPSPVETTSQQFLEPVDVVDTALQEVISYVAQLRFRTGAMYLFVADMAGSIMAQAGSPHDLDAAGLAAETADSLGAAIRVERALGGAQRPTLLLQRGVRYTVCSVAASPEWMLGMIYDQPVQGRRLEAVLRNMDQAVDALRPILEMPELDSESAGPEETAPTGLGDLEAILAQENGSVDAEMWSLDDPDTSGDGWGGRSDGKADGFFSLDEAQSMGLVDAELLRKLQGNGTSSDGGV